MHIKLLATTALALALSVPGLAAAQQQAQPGLDEPALEQEQGRQESAPGGDSILEDEQAAAPGAGQDQARQMLQTAEQQIQSARQKMQQAAQQSGPQGQQAIAAARSEATQALDQLDQALSQMAQGPGGSQYQTSIGEIRQSSAQTRQMLEQDPARAAESLGQIQQRTAQLRQQAGQRAEAEGEMDETAAGPATDEAAEADPLDAEEQAAAPGATEETEAPAAAPETPGAAMLSAEEIIGKTAVTETGKEAGRIADVVMSPEGEPQTAILERGGFLGLGRKRVAVDFEKLQPGAEDDQVRLQMTDEELAQAPEYEEGQGAQPEDAQRQQAPAGEEGAPQQQ